MFNKSTLFLLFFAVSFFTIADQESENLVENKQPPSSELVSHVGLLNELSSRRQVNTFTPNQSSAITQGLQKHFVNVGSGRLSFERRDLVTMGRKPLVLARYTQVTSKCRFRAFERFQFKAHWCRKGRPFQTNGTMKWNRSEAPFGWV
ncbi:MAG: hypothetical protein MJK04_28935 [Psychrosphaera sp.]|nr:hypothetical protein [Psychrosphaera sp.]